MSVRFVALSTETARRYQVGAPDANGQTPERRTSDGSGLPCRHCLRNVPKGEEYLVLAHRPFATRHPYAELGPIFLCAKPCDRHAETDRLPGIFAQSDRLLIRGYGQDERIVYGTGEMIATDEIQARAEALLARKDIAFLHLRSASNNCFQARIDKA
ncbi:DUF1203 domain-containing protein [Stappia sp. ES.058]|uniref:DUF1203 domain-containing protein n=1 Tax=Stappia sp. ES.058 TaxID=1881061 RepID=UPI00087C88CC|nr:DUF1203 domain-containing protein [Stappia sp. ES.058]SDT99869.1 Protein of unknown function [Stappia sp. ES.058]